MKRAVQTQTFVLKLRSFIFVDAAGDIDDDLSLW